MSKYYNISSIYIFLFTILSFNLNGQQINNGVCSNALPFCTGNVVTFDAGVNTGDGEFGNNYDCLGSTPNPAWFYLEIDTPGELLINITNRTNFGGAVDIDFILYGPFDFLQEALNQCGNLGGNTSFSGNNRVVDCSYDSQNFEEAFIANAQNKEVYLLLITNFANNPTQVSFTDNTSSTATTNCSITQISCSTSVTDITKACNGATGSVEIKPDGDAPYNYQLFDNNMDLLRTSNNNTNPDFSFDQLAQGNYSITTQNGEGCKDTVSFYLQIIPLMTMNGYRWV